MKSTIQDVKESNMEFPALLKDRHSSLIVLMTGVNKGCYMGTVVKENPNYEIGYYGATWAMNNFELFCGKVILEN